MFKLPEAFDDERDPISINVEFRPTISFANYYDDVEEIVFTLDSNVEPSDGYFFKVTLSDGSETNEYRVIVIIERNTPPYFVNWSSEAIEFTEGTGVQTFELP